MIARALLLCLVLFVVFSPRLAIANSELQERAAKWEAYFYPGVKALEDRDLMKAEELFRQALREIEPLGITAAAASTLSNLCTVYELQHNLQRARLLCNNAVAVSQRLRGNLHPDVALDLFHLAQVESKLGNYDEASKWLTHAIDIMRKSGNGLTPPTKLMLEAFAENLEKKGDSENAEKVRKAIQEASWQK
jgi:tetratricopeptide (TPR) repeat protein